MLKSETHNKPELKKGGGGLTGMFDPQFDFSSQAQTANFVQFVTKKKTKIYSSCRFQICYQSIIHIGAAVMMLARDPEIRPIVGYRNSKVIQMIYAVLHMTSPR